MDDGDGDRPTAGEETVGDRPPDTPEFDGSLDPVRAHWKDIVDEVEATASEYEDSGWTSLVLRPGDVTVLIGEEVDRRGFDVLLPDDEFDDLLDVVDAASFDESDVYTSVEGGVAFLMVVLQDETTQTAVLFPAYYREDDDDVDELRTHAEQAGRVQTHLRRLREDRVVTFEYETPGLFFPDSDGS